MYRYTEKTNRKWLSKCHSNCSYAHARKHTRTHTHTRTNKRTRTHTFKCIRYVGTLRTCRVVCRYAAGALYYFYKSHTFVRISKTIVLRTGGQCPVVPRERTTPSRLVFVSSHTGATRLRRKTPIRPWVATVGVALLVCRPRRAAASLEHRRAVLTVTRACFCFSGFSVRFRSRHDSRSPGRRVREASSNDVSLCCYAIAQHNVCHTRYV